MSLLPHPSDSDRVHGAPLSPAFVWRQMSCPGFALEMDVRSTLDHPTSRIVDA